MKGRRERRRKEGRKGEEEEREKECQQKYVLVMGVRRETQIC